MQTRDMRVEYKQNETSGDFTNSQVDAIIKKSDIITIGYVIGSLEIKTLRIWLYSLNKIAKHSRDQGHCGIDYNHEIL